LINSEYNIFQFYNGWGIKTDGIRWVKERKRVNETPTRVGSMMCFLLGLTPFL